MAETSSGQSHPSISCVPRWRFPTASSCWRGSIGKRPAPASRTRQREPPRSWAWSPRKSCGAAGWPPPSPQSWSGGISTAAVTSSSWTRPARRPQSFTRSSASHVLARTSSISESPGLVRAARLGLARSPPALLRLRLVATTLRDQGQRAPCPTRQLAVAKLLGDADRIAQVILRLVEPAHLPFRDASSSPRVRKLPARSEVGKYRYSAVEPGQRFLAAAEVVQHPRPLHGGVGDRELVARLLGERARFVDELQRRFVVVHLAVVDRK